VCERVYRPKDLHELSVEQENQKSQLLFRKSHYRIGKYIDESNFATRDGRFFLYEDFLEDVFREWNNVNENMHRDGQQLFGKRYMMVKYEDMKAGFNEVMSGILQWLKVDSSEEVTKFMDQNTNPAFAAEVPFVFRKGN